MADVDELLRQACDLLSAACADVWDPESADDWQAANEAWRESYAEHRKG